jgi:hygromycin-B 4-O-kinase
MSTAKTRVESKIIQAFLTARNVDLSTLETIADGELSQAFFYREADREKVLRVNSGNNEGFLKDKYAGDHFATSSLPIPKIEEIGKLSPSLHYAISERASGITLDRYGQQQINMLMPEIFKTLDAIHATPLAGDGYGWWQLDGNGQSSSWHEALDELQRAEDDYKLARVSFFEHNLRREVSEEIRSYYKFCPQDRFLVHADYGFNNALSDGKKITGVIDWHGSLYGDLLYDVAWLDFWSAQQGFAKMYFNHCSTKGATPANFAQRLTCYKLIIGINSLCFFAKSEQLEKYEYAKKILADIRAQ